ncbi:MAG: DUF2062 domain-containing protein [Spartobacteria bacterium]
MVEEASEKPSLWARLRRWPSRLHHRLVTIEDTPHSIALGVAIGIFFGFTPLWSLKTLLSIAVAWLCKSNKIAAAISVQLHDLILPFMPAIYLWEYKAGYLTMHGHLPRKLNFHALALRDYLQWEVFFTMGQPLLIGSVLIGLPSAVVVYLVSRRLVTRHRARRAEAG